MKVSALILAFSFLLFVGCLSGGANSEYKVTEFSDLFKNGTKIAACDSVHCPAGKYASMVVSSVELNNSETGKMLKRNIVTNDPHVRAVLDKVVTREVDAGFVYLTDAFLENDTVRIIEIPREFSPLPQYSVSTIIGSQNPEEAMLFEDFLMSKEGQQILVKYGFVPAVQEPISFEQSNKSGGKTLTIYAASSLTEVFTEFTEKFENATGISHRIWKLRDAQAEDRGRRTCRHLCTCSTGACRDTYRAGLPRRLYCICKKPPCSGCPAVILWKATIESTDT
jgi:molybdate transport system substrate-binding protein